MIKEGSCMKTTTWFGDNSWFFKDLDWKKFLVMFFFMTQLVLIVWARFAPERYFCWAPHDCQTEYELTVFVNGRELTDQEIIDRYHRPRKERDVRSPGNVQGWIMQESRTYSRKDDVLVIMNYQVNGVPQEPWKWHHMPENK